MNLVRGAIGYIPVFIHHINRTRHLRVIRVGFSGATGCTVRALTYCARSCALKYQLQAM